MKSLLVSALLVASSANAQEYDFTTISPPAGGINSVTAAGITDSGEVCGSYRSTGGPTSQTSWGFTYANGVTTSVKVPRSFGTMLTDMNRNGDLTGQQLSGAGWVGVVFSGGVFAPPSFPPIPGARGQVTGLSDTGWEAGIFRVNFGGNQGFVFDPRLQRHIVVNYPEASQTRIEDISNNGLACGTQVVLTAGPFVMRAFTYDSATGVYTPLSAPGWMWSEANGINDDGTVVGRVTDAAGATRSAIWDAAGMRLFDHPAALAIGGETTLRGINNVGDLCGSFAVPNGRLGFIAEPVVCQPDLGGGTPGGAVLSFCGQPLASGRTGDLSITGLPPGTATLLLLAATAGVVPIPFAGGTIIPTVPALAIAPFVANASGTVSLPGVGGGGGPAFVFMQTVYRDASLPSGWGLSNAVRLDVLR